MSKAEKIISEIPCDKLHVAAHLGGKNPNIINCFYQFVIILAFYASNKTNQVITVVYRFFYHFLVPLCEIFPNEWLSRKKRGMWDYLPEYHCASYAKYLTAHLKNVDRNSCSDPHSQGYFKRNCSNAASSRYFILTDYKLSEWRLTELQRNLYWSFWISCSLMVNLRPRQCLSVKLHKIIWEIGNIKIPILFSENFKETHLPPPNKSFVFVTFI